MSAADDGDAATQGSDRRDVTTMAKGGAINLVGSAGQAMFNAIILLVLGRGLGAGGSGSFLEAIAVFNIVAVTAALGVETGFIRAVSRARADGRIGRLGRTFRVGYVPVVVAGVVAAVVLLVAVEPIARVFGDAEHTAEIAGYLRVMAAFVPLGALAVATLGATRGFETMLPTVVVDRLGKYGMQALAIAVGVMVGLSARALATAWAVPVALASAWSVWWLRRLWLRGVAREAARGPDGPPAAEADPVESLRDVVRDFWTFTLPRTFASIFRITVQWLDVLLVGALMSPAAAGIYATATRLLQFGLAAALAVGQVSQPMISRLLARGHHAATKSLYGTATAWQVLMTWPQYLGVAIFAPALLALFGQEFLAGTTVVVILAVSAMIGSASGPVDMVLLMAGKSLWSFWNTALSLGLNVVLNLILIPRWGITGAAFAWAVSRVVGNLVPLLQIALALDLHPFGAKWVRSAVASLVAFGATGLAVRAWAGPTLPAALGYGVLAMAVYVPLLYRQREELDLAAILGALQRRFGRR